MILNEVRKTIIAIGAIALLVGGSVGPANATGFYEIELGYEFSGAAPPASVTKPWLTAKLFDNSYGANPFGVSVATNQVLLSMETTNLTGTEYVSGWYFNFNPAKTVGNLAFAFQSGTGRQGGWVDKAVNAYKADGDGYFDIRFNFPNAAASRLTNAKDSLYLVTISSGTISVADFMFDSVDGPVGKTGFPSAAHVHGIGSSGALSGWITDGGGDGGGIVPEPAFYQMAALLGLGGLGLLRLRRGAKK